jgi:RNA polymerase sigma factor (sigma-70 family)
MMRDPLADPQPLVRRVYAYVAYRLGDGVEAEDATSAVFERALRYRTSYDERRGTPLQWLLGIARRCVSDAVDARATIGLPPDTEVADARTDFAGDIVERLTLMHALDTLDERARDLIALRYGADLTARQIAHLMEMKTNAVEVALHRALGRLRDELEREAGRAVVPRDPIPEPPA